MLLSLNWLREFVPYGGTAEELGERLTMLGLELEELLHPYDGIRDVVLGRVLTCDTHPDSDHLHVTTVDLGGEALTIVCGAPNVAAGQLVAVAPVGAVLPGGLRIKKATLRGVPSAGMICSERELGLSDDHSGILVLPESNRAGRRPAPGERLIEAYDFDREVLDISITPNRGDCLSVLGFAREVAAAYGLPLTLPSFDLKESGPDIGPELPVEVRDGELCPCYTGRVLEGARVMPSPAWMRWRLHAVGIRPISNLVDVTNYILMELGQPLHAFDRDKLEGGRIIVSPAVEGERLITLDGQERELKPGDGLIRDAARPVALAGVMGGLATEITDGTKSVFLECAVFRPASVRRTARRLGLSSESSYRYERGVDQSGMDFARERAAALMAELSGASVRTGVCRCEPKPWRAPSIRFRRAKAEDLLGVPLEPDFCADTLKSLGCEVRRGGKAEGADDWNVRAPGWRYDLTREADLIEEVARFRGVDSLPATLPAIVQSLKRFGLPESRHGFLMRVKKWAAGLGLNEAINYSFVGNRDLDHLRLPAEGRVKILNPLTADQDVLRTCLAPGLLQDVRVNIAQGAAGLRLFEIAEAFRQDGRSETTVAENRRLGLVLYGARFDSAWPQPDEDVDYSDLKGLVEHFFLHCLHLPAPRFEVLDGHPYLAPAVKLLAVDSDGAESPAGALGRVRPDLADAYHARKAVWLADLDLDLLQSMAAKASLAFRALPVYPPVRRDITVIAPLTVRVATVRDALEAAGRGKRSLLESVELRDLYVPDGAEERRLTFRLTFRHADRTLQDAEVDREREKMAAALVQALPVRI
ncbi:MAG: phenylalanine--tRNA ligase subunit beta [Desulfovibrionaceae bacterium]|nr:phenylalanine--tRNA ligase subunit beta [Desulfovibrionaceae bacterium]